MKKQLLNILAAALMLAALSAKGTTMESKITKTLLPNRITLIHKQTGNLPIVDIRLFLNVGSLNEPEGKGGINSLLQVMMLKGTEKRTAKQIAMEIESMGGAISSEADEDFSDFSVSVTTGYFARSLDILADVFLNPTFPEDELKKEKQVTIAGIKSRKDHISNVASDLLMENLYGRHPYARIASGTEKSVGSLTRKDLLEWYKKYYGSRNMLFVVVGDISLQEARTAVQQAFAGARKGEKPETKFPGAVLKERKDVSIAKGFEQAYLMYGFLAPNAADRDYPALKILNAYLSAGMSSELFQVLREKAGLCYETSSYYPSKKDTSRFVIYLGLDETNIPRAREKIELVLYETKKIPIGEKRLGDIKNYIQGVYLLDHQTVSMQAWYLGWWEINGKGFAYDEKYLPALAKVTAKDVMKAAEKYFTDKMVTVEVRPEAKDKEDNGK